MAAGTESVVLAGERWRQTMWSSPGHGGWGATTETASPDRARAGEETVAVRVLRLERGFRPTQRKKGGHRTLATTPHDRPLLQRCPADELDPPCPHRWICLRAEPVNRRRRAFGSRLDRLTTAQSRATVTVLSSV